MRVGEADQLVSTAVGDVHLRNLISHIAADDVELPDSYEQALLAIDWQLAAAHTSVWWALMSIRSSDARRQM